MKFQCCFCGERIDETKKPRVEIALSYPHGSAQALYAHEDCLKKSLHDPVPLMIPREERDL